MEMYEDIRELLDALAREPLEELLKEIAEAPIIFTDWEDMSKPRRTRKRKKVRE